MSRYNNPKQISLNNLNTRVLSTQGSKESLTNGSVSPFFSPRPSGAGIGGITLPPLLIRGNSRDKISKTTLVRDNSKEIIVTPRELEVAIRPPAMTKV